MTTLAGTATMPAGAAVSAIVVGAVCALEMATVSAALAPSVTDEVGGNSEASAGAEDGVTVTLEVARELPRLAATCAVPSARLATFTVALSAPAGTLTVPGTLTMPLGWALNATVVAALRTELNVTLSVEDAPRSMRSVAGCSALTVAAEVMTLRLAVASPPVPPTVMSASPAATPRTGMLMLVCPIAYGMSSDARLRHLRA